MGLETDTAAPTPAAVAAATTTTTPPPSRRAGGGGRKAVEDILRDQVAAFSRVKLYGPPRRRPAQAQPELRDGGTTLWGVGCSGAGVACAFRADQLQDVTDVLLGEAVFTLEEAEALAKWVCAGALDAVETVDLGMARLPADGLAAVLGALAERGESGRMEDLDTLHLDGCTMTTPECVDAIANVMAASPSLRDVQLSHLYVDDGDVVSLCQGCINAPSIGSLTLDDNQIGPQGATALVEAMRGSEALTSLELNHNRLCDAGAATLLNALQYTQRLTHLGLGANGIHDLASLSASCLEDAALRSLSLRDNHLGVTGAIALGKAVRGATSLTALYVSNNRLGADGACVLLSALCEQKNSVRCLDLSNNEICTPQAFLDIAQYISDPSAQVLKLDLSDNAIGEDGLFVLDEAFPHATALRYLILQRCGLTDTRTYTVEIKGAGQQSGSEAGSEAGLTDIASSTAEAASAVGDSHAIMMMAQAPRPVLQVDIDDDYGSVGGSTDDEGADDDDESNDSDNVHED